METLLSKQEIELARGRLVERGLSCLDLPVGARGTWWQRLRREPAFTRLGDPVKSWDVLRTVELLERSFPKSARVLDIGAYNSEILCVLEKAGFDRLTGIDLNPDVLRMPSNGRIRYEVGDFLHSPFASNSFDAITAISVIEHGFDAPVLLAEISRLLAPGGSFIASFDYWPEKIDTRGVRFFGMPWCIFSREEVSALVAQAATYGLRPDGPLALDAAERAVHCAGRDYTFGLLVLRRG